MEMFIDLDPFRSGTSLSFLSFFPLTGSWTSRDDSRNNWRSLRDGALAPEGVVTDGGWKSAG